jgi:RNA ligase
VEFESFTKIPRLMRQMVVTEKIDGTNGQIAITEDGQMYVGSRNQWILTPDGGYRADPFGFARWALDHKDELIAKLGPGRHFGEWWGSGIQRGYGLPKGEKRFSLFNTSLWADEILRPSCCAVVPILFSGVFNICIIDDCLKQLRRDGSVAAPGFMRPEGVVVFHVASNALFKRTIEKDEEPKSSGVRHTKIIE